MTKHDHLQRLHEVRRLHDGRIIVSTFGGSNFALSMDDWQTAADAIARLAADPELEILYMESEQEKKSEYGRREPCKRHRWGEAEVGLWTGLWRRYCVRCGARKFGK